MSTPDVFGRINWQADCPKCVASKFTCDEHYRHAPARDVIEPIKDSKK